ncbi:hypothetical protein KY285_019613 [Solanum tuberosum]|nr:hypothetical protein KY285_019613 [Solanum tuberosum]
MVTTPDPYLQVWWKFMNNRDRRNVQRHISNLPSLIEMVAWPDLIGKMVKFWDIDNMVFRFGEVEMKPTIEEVLASYGSVDMCNKGKRQPNTNLLFPKTWDFAEIKEKSLLFKAKWMDKLPGQNIPLRKLYYRFRCARAYEKFKEEFVSKEKWKETRHLTFAICLLGTMKCNMILQWWLMRHLIKAHNPEEPDLLRRSDELASHD